MTWLMDVFSIVENRVCFFFFFWIFNTNFPFVDSIFRIFNFAIVENKIKKKLNRKWYLVSNTEVRMAYYIGWLLNDNKNVFILSNITTIQHKIHCLQFQQSFVCKRKKIIWNAFRVWKIYGVFITITLAFG